MGKTIEEMAKDLCPGEVLLRLPPITSTQFTLIAEALAAAQHMWEKKCCGNDGLIYRDKVMKIRDMAMYFCLSDLVEELAVG